jgi:hypothetical protein
VQGIIKDLQDNPNSHPHYKWVNYHLNRKGKIVVGNVEELKLQLISMYHDTAMRRYFGSTMTAKRVGNLFYWKRLQKQAKQYVKERSICQKNKTTCVKLQPLLIPQFPFTDASMDFIEGFLNLMGRKLYLWWWINSANIDISCPSTILIQQ